MRGFKIIFTFFVLCNVYVVRGQDRTHEKLSVTGIVCDRDSESFLPDVVCRIGKVSWGFGVNRLGSSVFEVNSGDTFYFSRVGYESIEEALREKFQQKDFLVGMFMVCNTIQLSEVLVPPRLKEFLSEKYDLNASFNELSALYGVSFPVKGSRDRFAFLKSIPMLLQYKIEDMYMLDGLSMEYIES